MRRYLVAAGSFTLLLAAATGVGAAQEVDHVVVADGLENPRQLNWSGHTLLVAEAGQGGDNCAPAAPETPAAETTATETPATETPATETAETAETAETETETESAETETESAETETPATETPATETPATETAAVDTPAAPAQAVTGPTSDNDDDGVCDGYTAGISAIQDPDRAENADAERIVDQLYSIESAEGSIGSDGVAATGFPNVLVIAQGEGTPDALAERGIETDATATETQEHLLLGVDGRAFPWVDLGEAETRLDPDGNDIADSNPNAVIVVDPTPDGEPGVDEYALVADAGANVVWKVTPDFSRLDANDLPAAEVTVFTAFPATEGVIQFVPSALDQDEDGNIYVGGVGGLAKGGASVVRLDADGDETERWDGFTGINGLAVDENGRHVYVSQILGTDGPPTGTGNVVRFDTEDETWTSVEVPFPSGLALGRVDSDGDDGQNGSDDDVVYVSAYSISPANDDDPATTDVTEGGQVWRFSFPDDATESPLPVTTPPDPAATAATEPDPTVAEPTVTEPTVTEPDAPVPDDDVTDEEATADDGTVGQGSAVAAL
jgi:hypothetical protein